MTGSQLKSEIKKLGLTQEEAARRLSITRQTLGVWFKYAQIDETTCQLVSAKLDINTNAFTNDIAISNNSNTVAIPTDVWDMLKDQAASLKMKDEQMNIMINTLASKDAQTAEMIAMLREELKKGRLAEHHGYAASVVVEEVEG